MVSPWKLEVRASERVKVGYVGDAPEAPLRIEGAYAAGLSFEFSIRGNRDENPSTRFVYEALVDLSAQISLGNRTDLKFKWWGEDDRSLGTTRAIRLPQAKDSLEGPIRVLGISPIEAVRGSLMITTVRQEIGDWLEISSILIDRFPLP